MQPNILLLSSDQQHWNTLGVRNPAIRTPNLDRLAGDGLLFERAYCPNPTCTPSRASMITGLYPSQHGAYALGTRLADKVPTIGGHLQAAGYDASLIGKAHFQQTLSTPDHPSLESLPLMRDLDFWKRFDCDFHGFNHVELARNHADEVLVGQHYALWMEEQGLHDWQKYFHGSWRDMEFPGGCGHRQHGQWSLPEAFHYNTWIAERTQARIDTCRDQDKPFFIWASFPDPHPPYLVPAPWDSMYDPQALTVPQVTPGEHDRNPPHFRMTQEKDPDFSAWQEPGGNVIHGFSSHLLPEEDKARNLAIYYGMISFMDHYIGRILNHLDTSGLADDTLVVFCSDHGHFYGQHGLLAKGAFHYEDLIRIPMLARWPGRIPAGKSSAALQSLVDLSPTLLGLAGLPVPPAMTGLNQSAVWLGEVERQRSHVLVENRHQPTKLYAKTFVDARYKLTVYLNRDYGELFDLADDPGECKNLWDEPQARDLKAGLMRKLVFADMQREPLPMPRVAPA